MIPKIADGAPSARGDEATEFVQRRGRLNWTATGLATVLGLVAE